MANDNINIAYNNITNNNDIADINITNNLLKYIACNNICVGLAP